MTDKPMTVEEHLPTKYIVTSNHTTAQFTEFNVAVAYFTWKSAQEDEKCRLYLAKPMIRIA